MILACIIVWLFIGLIVVLWIWDVGCRVDKYIHELGFVIFVLSLLAVIFWPISLYFSIKDFILFVRDNRCDRR